jgi:hypothetical protein
MRINFSIFRWLTALSALTVACALTPMQASADEFTLKDGRKITGTIVGYEGDMFRVQTDFGYVLIRKDKVVSIRVEPGSSAKPDETSAAKTTSAESPAPPPPASKPASTPAANLHPLAKPAAPPPPVSRPLDEPLPAHLREHIEGNDYINDSLHFLMYKPPDWNLMEELHREKVSAIVAMSSPDERTLLFVDRQVWSGVPMLGDDRVEKNLRLSYQDFKKISETSIQVDGLPAIRRRFTGVIDGAEWHGVSVHLARGNTVFGVIGLTSAETFQFQEAIFNKIIKSFRFLTAATASGTSQSKAESGKTANPGPA